DERDADDDDEQDLVQRGRPPLPRLHRSPGIVLGGLLRRGLLTGTVISHRAAPAEVSGIGPRGGPWRRPRYRTAAGESVHCTPQAAGAAGSATPTSRSQAPAARPG